MTNEKIYPKNLDVMREKIAANLDGAISQEAKACRELISKCEGLDVVEDNVLTIKQASVMLGVSEQTLRNWENAGKLIPQRTNGKNPRYLESQINPLRKKQLGVPEILLPGVTPTKIRALGEMLLSNFSPDEKINLIISQGAVDGKVRITIDSEDGLTTVCKTFNVEEE